MYGLGNLFDGSVIHLNREYHLNRESHEEEQVCSLRLNYLCSIWRELPSGMVKYEYEAQEINLSGRY